MANNSSLFDTDLWNSQEDVETEQYVDASGDVQSERVQSMPPPDLRKAGPTSYSSHVLERHTGNFESRPRRSEATEVLSTPFDDDQLHAYTRPDTAPSSHQQTQLVNRNKRGVQEAPVREDETRDSSLYMGYNLRDPDSSRQQQLPLTNRSCEPESSWTSRAIKSSMPEVSTVAPSEPTKKYGSFAKKDTNRAKKNEHDGWVPRPATKLARNSAYGIDTVVSGGRNALVAIPASQSKINPGRIRPEHAWNDARVTSATHTGNILHGNITIPEDRNDVELEIIAMGVGEVNAATVGGTLDLTTEEAFDEKGDRPTRTVSMPQHIRVAGVVGQRDANRALPVHKTTDVASNRRMFDGTRELNPLKDGTQARQETILQPSTLQSGPRASVLTSDRPEIQDKRDPLQTHTTIHVRPWRGAHGSLAPDAALVPRTAPHTFNTHVASTAHGMQRPLRDDTFRTPGAPRVTTRAFDSTNFKGHIRVGENDAMSIEEAHRRVRSDIQRTGPSGDTARLPNEELEARPTIAPQVSNWEMRGPIPYRTNVPRNMNRADYHSERAPLFTGSTVNAAKSKLDIRETGRETPTMAPIASRNTVSTRPTSMPEDTGTIKVMRQNLR